MMVQPGNAKRVLFVDDEASIRLTLAPVLEEGGFEVRVAGSVPEALVEINSYEFNVLISDLNIEKPGDGFLVISAMRHIQPDCVNVILTGYPAIETALQAIQNQVDDYIIKPADTEALVNRMREKLAARKIKPPTALKRLCTILKEHRDQITENVLDAMKHAPKVAALALTREERIDHLPTILHALIEQLEAESTEIGDQALRFALEHGKKRKKQGYDIAVTVRDFQFIEEAIYELMQSDVMPIGAVGLTSDLARLTKGLHQLAIESLGAYAGAKRRAE